MGCCIVRLKKKGCLVSFRGTGATHTKMHALFLQRPFYSLTQNKNATLDISLER